jgi:hypothetical protein
MSVNLLSIFGIRPPERLISAVGLALFVATCGPNDSPVAPTVIPSPFPTFTLSGVVAEDGKPIENAMVEVDGYQPAGPCTAECFNRPGTFIGFPAGGGMTDVSGRYRAHITRREDAPIVVSVVARKDGYVQQCPATIMMQGDAELDVTLTSIANLSAARSRSRPGSRMIFRTVFEPTPAGRPPVPGIWVSWSPLNDVTHAATSATPQVTTSSEDCP